MAFIYDELSVGFHPDFCSPCSANDCHGACVCPVEKPEPGLLCDMCGGTGCPKCGCIPAPQQTFLAHQRLSFPKCTCDMCPKKCWKCCRKRVACDCLPPDTCRYSEEADKGGEKLPLDAWGKREWNTAREECQEEMETVLSPYDDCPDPCDNECPPYPPPRKFPQPSCATCMSPKAGNSNNANSLDTDNCKPSRRKRRGKRSKSRRRRTRSRGGKGRSGRKRIKFGKDPEFGPVCEGLSCGPSEACYEGLPGELFCTRDDMTGKVLTDYEVGDGEYKYDMCDPERQICSAKVTRRCGPCTPPPPLISKEHDEGACCKSDCEKPCLPPQLMSPCNPRPACVCRRDCKKEYCMIMHGNCLRCSPKHLPDMSECKPCTIPKGSIKKKPKPKKHPCDDSEECEDPCEALFGTCDPPQPCVKECTTGECENACLIM